ncbi:hypothetical protein AAFF_G00058200 [Aldrovandia affinis]|uniref:Uncharacterized protein n=1 Tax=Aldrovandia affinis TaxID=143900 RepID=A0AAD7S068_9TELE|nr:hypothetical protein AAFF_G00058200 [Aldrovandia affinis]
MVCSWLTPPRDGGLTVTTRQNRNDYPEALTRCEAGPVQPMSQSGTHYRSDGDRTAVYSGGSGWWLTSALKRDTSDNRSCPCTHNPLCSSSVN